MTTAITRQISPRFNECELTHIERSPIDLDVARQQHRGYAQTLESTGCQVIQLPALPEFPDSVFVEDTAIILPELAVLTRPGAASRRGEIDPISETLSPFRELVRISEPATLDGGDVLVMAKDIYVGLSTRSGRPAIDQLAALLARFGYHVHAVALTGCLHLKSAVTRLHEGGVLINRTRVDTHPLEKYELIDVSPREPDAANILMIGEQGIFPAAFPETGESLERRGVRIRSIDLSELAKAEGAVTCCSLII